MGTTNIVKNTTKKLPVMPKKKIPVVKKKLPVTIKKAIKGAK